MTWIQSLLCIAALTAAFGAEALTFCSNTKNVNGGIDWMYMRRDVCLERLTHVTGLERFAYNLTVSKTNTCVYESPRTKALGEKLICKTNLTRNDVREIAKSKGLTSVRLYAMLRTYNGLHANNRDLVGIDDIEIESPAPATTSETPPTAPTKAGATSSPTTAQPITHTQR